jgi:hypothetical protein
VKVLVVGRIMLDIDKAGDGGRGLGVLNAGFANNIWEMGERGVDGVEYSSGLLNIEGGAGVWRSRLSY